MRAVALLSGWKIKNALRTLFTDPRKLVPAILIFLSMGCGFGSMLLSAGSRKPNLPGAVVDPILMQAGLAAAMILLGLAVLGTGLDDGLLAFALPDVDYLFPSPISRRTVLAYRLPALTWVAFASGGFLMVFFTVMVKAIGLSVPHPGNMVSSTWMSVGAVGLCVGIYLNLALFIAIRVPARRLLNRLLVACTVAMIVGFGLVAWRLGVTQVVSILDSPWFRWPFLPSRWAADAMFAVFTHQPVGPSLGLLLLGYAMSLIPMFATNANYYEQSIVSTERISRIRLAAKGGYASLMAAKASSYKRKITRTYTVAPFGQGPVALFWAHLCAAAKRPFTTFGLPLLGGVGGSLAAAILNQNQRDFGFGFILIGLMAVYGSIGFMASGKTASEAALRRRELIAPLPIRGWQAVAANLGVPWLVAVLFSFGAALTYSVMDAREWPLVAFGFGIVIPLHLATRMTLQYLIVLGYPDFADKVQQLLGQGVYYVVAGPITGIEVILCVPAILMKSVPLALATLAVAEIPLLALLLFVTGRAAERSVASGEPVSVLGAFKR